jgi:hypothetical protein
MRDWARVISLVLATSACKEDAVADKPADAPTNDASARAAEAAEETKILAGDAKRGAGAVEIADGPDGPSTAAPKHGLSGLTREMIDQARRTLSEPLQLVPDTAHFVMRARPAVLLAHAEVQAIWTKTEESNVPFKGAMDVVRACLVRLEAVDDVVLGFDDSEHLVLAAHAKGIGTDETWRCFQKESLARSLAFDLTLTGTARGEGPQLREKEGNLGYFPDDDTVVLVSKDWDADVQARLRNTGTAAIAGSLAAVVGRMQQDDPLWVAGRITGKSESGLVGSPMAGIDDVTFGMRIDGSDLVLSTTADAGEAADATRVRDELQRQVDQYKSFIAMMGLPATLGPKLAFVTEGDLVSLGLTLTADELRSTRETIERSM